MLEYVKIILFLITCLIILLTLLKLRSKNIKRDEWKFLLSSLFLTLFLALIIEIKPHHMLRAQFNISNLIIYLFYFVIVSSYFLRYLKLLLRYKYVLIVISYMFFGLANAFDLLADGKIIELLHSEIIEDIFHILGIVFWLTFFIDYSNMLKTKYQ
jgi:hypothetical protein